MDHSNHRNKMSCRTASSRFPTWANAVLWRILGLGSCSFAALASMTSGQQYSGVPSVIGFTSQSRAVTHGDFDADGDVDLAFALDGPAASRAVAICTHMGDRNFALSATYPIPSSPTAILARDVDSDGHMDLIVTSTSPNPVQLLRNSGSGAFTVSSTNLTADRSLVLADVDGDGDDDALWGSGTSVNLQLNLGSFVFGVANAVMTAQYGEATSLVTSDLDGDGDLDLIALYFQSMVSVLFNDGSGVFGTPYLVASGGTDTIRIAASDIDADGDQDLVVCGYSFHFLVFWNGGGGSFTSSSYVTLPGAADAAVTVADVDSDGDGDVITASTTGRPFVSLNQGSHVFGPGDVYLAGRYVNGLTVADLDSDGHLDLAFASDIGWIDWNRGDGSFPTATPSIAFPAIPTHLLIAAGDLDGDGDADLATCSKTFGGAPMVLVLRNDGDTSLSLIGTYPLQGAEFKSMGLADLDGDADLDLVLSDSGGIGGASYFQVLENQGGGALSAPIIYPIPFGHGLQFALADFDNDGDMDVCELGSLLATANRLFVFPNDGTGSFASPVETTISGRSFAMTSADFDGDGDVDVATASDILWTVEIHVNLGSGAFAPAVAYSLQGTGYSSQRMASADIDDDGDFDLVVSSEYPQPVARAVSVLLNNGNGTFGPVVRYPVPHGDGLLTITDFDGDGRKELLVGSGLTGGASGSLAVFRWSGGGVFTLHSESGLFGQAKQGIHYDVDGDGDLDAGILVQDYFAWLRNTARCGITYCSGDGTSTSCPCGGTGSSGQGCPNSVSPAGAGLIGSGVASILGDSLTFHSTGAPDGPGLYLEGTNPAGGGPGLVLGDGLRCVGGQITRLGIANSVGGASRFPAPTGTRVSMLGLAAVGVTRQYQMWYRDSAPSFCSTSRFNFTNGLSIVWTP